MVGVEPAQRRPVPVRAHLAGAGHGILARELPDVIERIATNGGLRYNAVDNMLQAIEGATPEPEDARFDTVTGRRSTIEWALATTLADEPNVTVQRNSAIVVLSPDRLTLQVYLTWPASDSLTVRSCTPTW